MLSILPLAPSQTFVPNLTLNSIGPVFSARADYKDSTMLSASFLYAGYSDYFCGHGCEESEYLLYAYYGRRTTLRDIIDELVDDSQINCELVTIDNDDFDSDVREALLNMLTDAGRADYANEALSECAAVIDPLIECPECAVELDSNEDYDCCPECGACLDNDESPVFIVLLTYEKPDDCVDQG